MTDREMIRSSVTNEKLHAVCLPFPAQGHVTPMLALAKLLHSSGFHITFVNTEYNHCCLLRSLGQTKLTEVPDFQFMTIPDGLPFCHEDSIQDIGSLCVSTSTTGLPHFKDLLHGLNNNNHSDISRVTCVVADSTMSFALDAAKEIEVPCALLRICSSCSFMGYLQFRSLISRGLVPLKDLDQLSNGFLDTLVDSIPSMTNMRLRDFRSFIHTTDLNDAMFNLVLRTMESQSKASAIIMHAFDELEHTVLLALKSIMSPPPIYCVGPLQLLVEQIVTGSALKSLSSNLLMEEKGCFKWLEDKKARSVVYVNFGSIAVMSSQQLIELAWGLANSKFNFLWIIRPDLALPDSGSSTEILLPQAFFEEVKQRGLIAHWCPQSEVLAHKAIGLFLTHSGWNSTLESICNGVPMLCLPLGANQQTNCRYVCTEWQIGMELDSGFKRDDVELAIREMMEGAEGKTMKERAMKWKESAKKATLHGGSSFLDLQKLLHEVLIISKNE